ncbi:hypothetical protein JCM14076_18330 [Methylosoma difficile]
MLNFSTLSDANFNLPLVSLQELAAVIVLALLCVFIALELLTPRDKAPSKMLRQSYKTNLLLFVINSLAMSLLSTAPLFLLAGQFAGQGVLALLPNVFWQAVFAFVILDILLYAWHLACHRFTPLWMFHRVHHNDKVLNSSTAFRVHVLELLATTLVKAAYVVAMGIDQAMLLMNEIFFTGFVIFHHSNIRFKGEKWLARILIVPYLHKAHHSTQRHEHDRNYGSVLSIWDRCLGTLTEANPMCLGIKSPSPQHVWGLLKFGFTPITDAVLTPVLPANLETMIAEAAYYKAEQRNFMPGDDVRDWLDAKAEIINRFCGDNAVCQRMVDV